jgi:hypothetical protein
MHFADVPRAHSGENSGPLRMLSTNFSDAVPSPNLDQRQKSIPRVYFPGRFVYRRYASVALKPLI